MNNPSLKYKKRVKETFGTVLDAPTGDRGELLDSLCGNDSAFRIEIEKMLNTVNSLDDFMELPVAGEAFNVYEDYLSDSLVGRKIGKYKLKTPIGQGGMGTVFLAERDDEIKQQVAVKIISPFAPSESDTENFRRERQILARLEHPTISRLLDAGATPDGIPYLVMEYVDGVSLTKYCSENNLSLEGRLALFLAICEGVKFAHQNLVIHRDLKPTNILVTKAGSPKLLDFGIAKMLRSKPFELDTEFTLTTKILTPNYASPEQLKGESITTASDVFSLGIILFEMLTGSRPHDLQNKPLPEILRAISEETPVKPSLRAQRGFSSQQDNGPSSRKTNPSPVDSKRLKGDLDTIVLKALEKDLKDRYQTVEQLTDDIGRYRNNLPILAKPPSKLYKLKKFVQRNRLSVASACAITLLGLILLGTALWFARVSDQQAQTYLRQVYSSDMNLAMKSYETSNIASVRNILDRYKDVEFRGWEYSFLQNLVNPAARINSFKHPSEVWSITFSKDGKLLATSCADGFARIFDARSGKLLAKTSTRETNIWKADFSPNGAFLATASGDTNSTSVKIWNVKTGEEFISLVGHTSRVRAIQYSPDGNLIATGSRDGTIRFWNPRTGKEIRKIKIPLSNNETIETHDLAFSPNGTKLLLGHAISASIYDLSTNELAPLPTGIASNLAVAFSPDGDAFAVGTQGSKIDVFSAKARKRKFTIRSHKARINDVVYSPNGKVIASASSDRTIRFFDAETGAEIKDLRTHSSDVWSIAFSPDGSYFASGSTDFEATLFDRQLLFKSLSFGTETGFSRQWSAISSDKKKIATISGSEDEFQQVIYDITEAKPTLSFSTQVVNAGAFSPNDDSLATLISDGSIVVWDTKSGRKLMGFNAHSIPEGSVASGRTIAYSPDGKHIVSGGFDKSVKLWNAKTGKLVRLVYQFKNRVSRVGFSMDGTRIFAASYDSAAKLFDSNSGDLIADLGKQPKPILSVAFSPDGKTFATGGADGVIKIWNAINGSHLKTYSENAGFIWQVAFSPDGKRLASATGEGVIRLWDTESDLEVLAIRTDSAVTNLLSFTRDGKTLVSHGTNERIRLRESTAR